MNKPHNPFKKDLIISESDHYGVGLLLKEPGEQVICEFDNTDDAIFHAEFIKHAVNSHNGLCVDLTMTTIALQDTVDREKKLKRQQEIIADLSWSMGNSWAKLDNELCSKLMDHVEGSFGLHQRVIGWAEEFDTYWEAPPEEERDDFLGDIDTFYTKKYHELLAEVA